MLEEHEETLEDWWFKVHPKDEKEDLHTYFCINKLQGTISVAFTEL